MASLQRHRDLHYERWIKLLKGLYMVKDVLCLHVTDVLDDFHQKVLTLALGAYRCDALTPVWDKITNTWSLTGGPTCTHLCADWLNRIAAEHVQYPSGRKDMFKLCDLTQLNTSPWEIAKAYLPDYPKAQSTTAPAELDPYYLMRMIKDCKLFTSIHAEVEPVHQTRNELAHAADQGINTDREVEERMNEMIDLVKLLPEAPASALRDLEKVRDGQIEEIDQGLSKREMDIIQIFLEGSAKTTSEMQAVGDKMVVTEIKRMKTPEKQLRSPTEDSSSKRSKQDYTVERLKAELADTYLQHYSNLQPVPWSSEVNLPIDLLYQEQTVMERKDDSRQHQGSSELKSILELLGEEQSRPGTIIIEGPPGMGKSTLCQQLIHTWALRVRASASEPATRESVCQHQAAPQYDLKDSLHQYQLVFFIRVGDLIDADLTRHIQEHIVNSYWGQEDLKICISEHIEQVLLIIDGYDQGDEAQKGYVDRWLKGTDCTGCTLIVTSRPGFCRPTAQPEQNHNGTYTLMGLDRAKQQDFASKFDQALGVGPGKRSASEQLQQFQDQDFLQTPMLLALVCILARQDQGVLPKNVSGLYNMFTEFLPLKAMQGPFKLTKDYVYELLNLLQKIAFKLFQSKKSEITSDILMEHVSKIEIKKTMDNLCKLGLVQQEMKLRDWGYSQIGTFINQSFLDYFSALYFVSASKEERSALLEGIEMQENMLVLAAGLCGESEEQHRECFGQMLEAWKQIGEGELEEEGHVPHFILHAYCLWLIELHNPSWLHKDYITTIYQVSNKASDGKGIEMVDNCITSCWRGVTTLLEATEHHKLQDSCHVPLDPATFKLDVCMTSMISTTVLLDLLKIALKSNVKLTCESLYLCDRLTSEMCERVSVVIPCLTDLEVLYIAVSSWADLNIVFKSTSHLERLIVHCLASSSHDLLPSSVDHSDAQSAADHWSPHKLIDGISRLSKLQKIDLHDEASTLTTTNKRDITWFVNSSLRHVTLKIYTRDSQTGGLTLWKMD